MDNFSQRCATEQRLLLLSFELFSRDGLPDTSCLIKSKRTRSLHLQVLNNVYETSLTGS